MACSVTHGNQEFFITSTVYCHCCYINVYVPIRIDVDVHMQVLSLSLMHTRLWTLIPHIWTPRCHFCEMYIKYCFIFKVEKLSPQAAEVCPWTRAGDCDRARSETRAYGPFIPPSRRRILPAKQRAKLTTINSARVSASPHSVPASSSSNPRGEGVEKALLTSRGGPAFPPRFASARRVSSAGLAPASRVGPIGAGRGGGRRGGTSGEEHYRKARRGKRREGRARRGSASAAGD